MKKYIAAILCTAVLLTLVFSPAALGADESSPDAWGYSDDDGDGLVLVTVPGETFTAYMLIVYDPSRVILGCFPDMFREKGYTVEEFVEMFGAVAGTNAGGFEDYGGNGDGSTPDKAVIRDGELLLGGFGMGSGFTGIDFDGILHAGIPNAATAESLNIKEGVSFGPVLVIDGEINYKDLYSNGLNPRTAIGQRADGAILLLVIDGRQPNSLGASFEDEAKLMLEFGAVNAANLDGGSSSLMWIDGEYINNKASVIKPRKVPTAFLVMPEGAGTTEAFEERFGSFDPSTVQPKAEDPVYADDATGELRENLSELALEYMRRYVTLSADVGNLAYQNYYHLVEMIVPNGELHQRMRDAVSMMGFVQAKACSVVEEKVNSCSLDADGRFAVEISWTTESTGTADPVLESRNMRVFIVDQGGKCLVDGMTLY